MQSRRLSLKTRMQGCRDTPPDATHPLGTLLMCRNLFSTLALLLFAVAAPAATHTVSFTVSAGKYDRAQEPVCISLQLPASVSPIVWNRAYICPSSITIVWFSENVNEMIRAGSSSDWPLFLTAFTN